MESEEHKLAALIGLAVRHHRQELGWSQAKLAEIADLSPNYVGFIERGERMPSVPMLVRLAAVLGTTVGSLLGEDDARPRRAENPIRRDSGDTVGQLLRELPEAARPYVRSMLNALIAELNERKARESRRGRQRR